MGGHRAAAAGGASEAKRRTPACVQSSRLDWHSVCLEERDTVGDAAPRDGLRQRDDLLATSERLASRRCVGCHPQGVVGAALPGRAHRLVAGVPGCRQCACSRGGEATGRNPTDRGKSGSKRHLVVDRQGIPLAIRHTGANVHDSRMLETMVDAIPALRGPRGRPRQRPAKLHADKAYDSRKARQALRRRGITPRLARRNVDSSHRLGLHRWVVERTLGWLNRFRRLKVRYERRADIHQAFLTLGCALICWNFVRRFC